MLDRLAGALRTINHGKRFSSITHKQVTIDRTLVKEHLLGHVGLTLPASMLSFGRVTNTNWSTIKTTLCSANNLCDVCCQALKQMYVLVLGLDVLGNPFALITGLTEGAKDFFYEPYQVRSALTCLASMSFFLLLSIK